VLAALLTEPQPASDSAARVFSVTEMVTIEALPERPLSEPVSRPDKQKPASKITSQPPQSIIQTRAPEHPLVVSQKVGQTAKPAVAQSFTQPQPIAQLSVEKPSRSAAAPAPVATASRQTGKQQSLSKEGERKLVRKHLEAFKYYPGSARRRGIEGHVDVEFTLAQNGAATGVAVLQGSGYAILDQAAMETVYRAQPFPIQKGEFRFRLRFKRL
jgi:protein TonB